MRRPGPVSRTSHTPAAVPGLRTRAAHKPTRPLPREHAQHQVKHEEGADDDERDEVEPVPRVAGRVVCLEARGDEEGRVQQTQPWPLTDAWRVQAGGVSQSPLWVRGRSALLAMARQCRKAPGSSRGAEGRTPDCCGTPPQAAELTRQLLCMASPKAHSAEAAGPVPQGPGSTASPHATRGGLSPGSGPRMPGIGRAHATAQTEGLRPRPAASTAQPTTGRVPPKPVSSQLFRFAGPQQTWSRNDPRGGEHCKATAWPLAVPSDAAHQSRARALGRTEAGQP